MSVAYLFVPSNLNPNAQSKPRDRQAARVLILKQSDIYDYFYRRALWYLKLHTELLTGAIALWLLVSRILFFDNFHFPYPPIYSVGQSLHSLVYGFYFSDLLVLGASSIYLQDHGLINEPWLGHWYLARYGHLLCYVIYAQAPFTPGLYIIDLLLALSAAWQLRTPHRLEMNEQLRMCKWVFIVAFTLFGWTTLTLDEWTE